MSELEECIDALDAVMPSLDRFPEMVLAFALRAHLAALLDAMASRGEIGETELRSFLGGLASEFHVELKELPADGLPVTSSSSASIPPTM